MMVTPLKWRTTIAATSALMLAASVFGAFSATMAPTSANAALADSPVLAFEKLKRDGCQAELDSATTSAQRQRARNCIADADRAIAWLSRPTPGPTVSPSPSLSPSASPSPSTSPTPSPTIPGPSVCPPLPAFPDGGCTGYRHTGVTEAQLTACPLRLTVANAVYDKCRFDGTLVIAAANITITRSLVFGSHIEAASGQSASLLGLRMIDVEVSGTTGNTDFAQVGNNDYSCLRCDVHGGKRGFALGSNITITDSWVHGFNPIPGAHQTAASTHGSSNVVIDHSRLRCESDRYGCSNGISFYAEDSDITGFVIKNSHISTDAGYGIGFYYLQAGKPHDIRNVQILNNVFGSWEYGMVANWMGSRDGNVWSGNVQEPFDPVCRC